VRIVLNLALVLATSVAVGLQSPKDKSAPRPSPAGVAETIVIRNPQPGGWVMFFFDPKFLAELDQVIALNDGAKLTEFFEQRKAKNEWKPMPSFVPASMLEEKTMRGLRGSLEMYQIEISDGPDKGLKGWVARAMAVRADKSTSIERKLDLERTVAKKKAREAQAALARAKKKASEIKDDRERRAYLEKMAPVWEAQGRDNLRMALEVQTLQIQAANAQSLRRSAMAIEREAAADYYRSGAPIIYDPVTGPRPYGLPVR
jgi:hypothetical protein